MQKTPLLSIRLFRSKRSERTPGSDRYEEAPSINPAEKGGQADPRYDAFISFRHNDARASARAIRLALLRWRLPPNVRAENTGPLRVFVDTFEGRVTDDFWKSTIEPALKQSRYLIVLVSPTASEPLADGQENWLVREVKTFLKTPQGKNIIPIFTKEMAEEKLPVAIARALPRVQTFHLGNRDRFLPLIPLLETPASLDFLRIVAAVRNVHRADYAILMREEWRRKLKTYSLVTIAVSLVSVAVTIGAVLAIYNGLQAARTSAHSDFRIAVESAIGRPDEAVFYAARALNTVASSALFRLFLKPEEARIRELLGVLRLPDSEIQWPGGRVASMKLWPDGSKLVVWTEGSQLAVYDAQTLEQLMNVHVPAINGSGAEIEFRQDAIVLMSNFSDEKGVFVVELDETLRHIKAVPNSGQTIMLPSGEILMHSGADGLLRMLDPVSGAIRQLGQLPGRQLEAATWLGPDRLIIHTALDGPGSYEQHILDAANGKPIIPPGASFQMSPTPEVLRQAAVILRHSAGGEISLVDARTGKIRRLLASPSGLPAASVSSSPDGRLAFVTRWPSDVVEIWDLIAGIQIALPLNPVRLTADPVFSSSGRQAALLNGSEVLVVDLSSPEVVKRLPLGAHTMNAIFLEQGEKLAVSDISGRVSIFNAATGMPVLQGLRHHEGAVQFEELPENRLASAGWDGTVRATKKAYDRQPDWQTETAGEAVTAVALHPSEPAVAYATSGGEIVMCVIGAPSCRWSQPTLLLGPRVQFFGGGQFVLASSTVDGFAAFRTDSGEHIVSRRDAKAAVGVDSTVLVVAAKGEPLIVTDSSSGGELCRSRDVLNDVRHIHVTSDGRHILVTVVADGAAEELRLFDAKTCIPAWTTPSPIRTSHVLASSVSLGFVALGGASGGAVFSLQDGTELARVDDRNMITDLAFSAVDPTLVALGASRRITALDLGLYEQGFSPIEANAIPWSIAFAPSGNRFAVASITADAQQRFRADLYDAKLGVPIAPPFLHPQDVLSISVSFDGSVVATGCADGLVRVWRIGADWRSVDEILRSASLVTAQTIDMGNGAIRPLEGPLYNRPDLLPFRWAPSIHVHAK